tara:strand:+ start:29 stop:1660 length:1632 start_codon:yes stop_codon:yes gene_type:complete
MIKLFSEEVNPTFTSSKHNILTVESYSEIFFDVFEFEINGTTYIAEKLSEYKGMPVVAIPVIEGDKKSTIPFVLSEGSFEVLYNNENSVFVSGGVDECILESIMIEDDVVDIARDYKDGLLEEVEVAKQHAAEYAERIKLQKIAEADKTIEEKKQSIREFFNTARVDLLDEFNAALVDNRQDVEVFTEQKHSEIEKYLTSRIENNFSEFFDINEERIKELTSLVEAADKRVIRDVKRSIADQGVVLTEKIKKGVDKALGRVGNVKTVVGDLESQLLERIETVDGSIREYYDVRIIDIRDEVNTISESQKDHFINLIEESKTYLLDQIKQEKDKTVKTLIEEKYDPKKGSKDFNKNLKKLKLDLERDISDKFRKEIMSLRRIIELSGGGGGSVAKQFADGGVMNGDLEVKGCVTAECFILSNPNSDDYTRSGIFRDESLIKDVTNTTCTFPININPALSTAKFHVTYTSDTGRSFVEVWIGHMDGNCYISGYSIINTDEVNPLLVSLDCSVAGECLNIISVVSSDCTGVFSGTAVYVDDPNFVL